MMKKSIFAVAVASALTLGAAQAETVLYGSVRYDYENTKGYGTFEKDTRAQVGTFENEGGYRYHRARYLGSFNRDSRLSNLEDAGSRIGIKGSEDLGNGNAVIFNLEFGFNGMTQDESAGGKTRKAVLGLTGNWGTFTAGRQDNPFHQTLVDDSIVDDFNGSNVISAATQRAMTSVLDGKGLSTYSTHWGSTAWAEGTQSPDPTHVESAKFTDNSIHKTAYSRVGKVIAYTTPNMSGFSANAALMMDAKIGPEKGVDLWTINAQYAHELGANGTFLGKLGYINGKLEAEKAAKMWGLNLSYKQDAFGVSLAYAKGDHNKGNATHKHKAGAWDVGASYSFGANYFSTIRVAYGQNDLKYDGAKDKVKSWAVGFEQKLSTRTRAWVEYGQEEKTYNKFDQKNKFDTFSIGMRHDF